MQDTNTKEYQEAFRAELKIILEKKDFSNNLQNIHTPYSLCLEMIEKLKENTDLADKDFLVFNLEFVEVLLYDFGVAKERVWFVTDCKEKMALIQHARYNGINGELIDFSKGIKNMNICKNKFFDVIIGNPPYQKPKNIKEGKTAGTTGGDLWSEFVCQALALVEKNGFVSFIHPSMWRKPDHEIYELLKLYDLKYLEIHGEEDGRRTFKASTRYDWYILQNNKYNNKTEVKDEVGKSQEININDWKWLPNYSFEIISKIIASNSEERCEVLYARSSYGSDKPWMSATKNNEFKYSCIYGMQTGGGITYLYSNRNDKGHFGVPKVILGWGRYLYPLIDFQGEYGMTQNAFGIKVASLEEAHDIKRAIESDKFKEILKATKWGTFQTDWRMFKYFRKDFWKEFINE